MPLYAFLDESGEYTFHAKSPRYLIYTGVVTTNPMLFTVELATLKYALLEEGLDAGKCEDCFHATTDKQTTRDKVYAIIQSSNDFEVHSIVVRKNRVNPSLYKFGPYYIAYRTMLKYMLAFRKPDRLHIIVDTPPDKAQQAALKKSLKARADEIIASRKIPYTIDHHKSGCHALLQVADYCAWAIMKKWQSGDMRSYNLISGRIRNEFDIYVNGDKDYYVYT